MGKVAILRELWVFLKIKKKWWLTPIIIFIIIISALLVFVQHSAVAPVIYTLF
jgi:hypothetical protein